MIENNIRRFFKNKIKIMKNTFKEKVLAVVKKIPSGRTMTYKQAAKMAGSPKAWRAVGSILSRNYDEKVPCHRVIRSDGSVGKYNRGTKNKIEKLKREKSFYPTRVKQ